MKAEFQVLKASPKIQVVLTRDSVCARDDCDAPHKRTIEAFSLVDPEAFVREVSSGYLPSVAGVGHSWTCVLNGVDGRYYDFRRSSVCSRNSVCG
jgi:hypothetical protein